MINNGEQLTNNISKKN